MPSLEIIDGLLDTKKLRIVYFKSAGLVYTNKYLSTMQQKTNPIAKSIDKETDVSWAKILQ